MPDFPHRPIMTNDKTQHMRGGERRFTRDVSLPYLNCGWLYCSGVMFRHFFVHHLLIRVLSSDLHLTREGGRV